MVKDSQLSAMLFLKVLIFGIGFVSFLSSCTTNATDKRNDGDWAVVLSDKIYNNRSRIDSIKFEEYKSGIETFYQKNLLRSGFNGGILVAKNGEILFEKYNGYFNLKDKDTLTSRSAFHLASVSKTFTAMGILKLMDKGLVHLDDSMQTFFPGFPYQKITVKNLLTHRSGLANYAYFLDKTLPPNGTYFSNRDVLNYIVEEQPPLTANPDTRFQYSNTNFALLALIIEKVTGKSYEEFMSKTFFDPLGMKSTYVFDVQRDSATAMPSFNYRGQLEAFTFLDAIYGDKNIYSTPEDLLRWDQALYDTSIFPTRLTKLAFEPYSHEKPGVKNYGLGWRMNVYPDGNKIIYHNGWWHGNNTAFIRDIQDSATIIVLGNRFDKTIYRAKNILDVFESGRVLEDE